MTIKEFKESIDFIYSNLNDYDNYSEIQVVIPIAEPSIGARACVNIVSMHRGMDWEHGRINLCTNVPIVRKGNSKENIVLPYEEKYIYKESGRSTTIRSCKMCGSQTRKDDRYCSNCGQRLK